MKKSHIKKNRVEDVERKIRGIEIEINTKMTIFLHHRATMIMIMITEIDLAKILSLTGKGVGPCPQLWDMIPMGWLILDTSTNEN